MLNIMRALLIIFASVSGYFIADRSLDAYNIFGSNSVIKNNLAYFGLGSGFIIAVIAILFEQRARKTPLRIVVGGAFGLIIGLVVANLLTYPLVLNVLKDPYLDDGTMVVIDNAKRHMGKNVDVAVTSVLQTTSGRMVFSKLKEEIRPELYYQASN